MQLPSEKATRIVRERGRTYGHPYDNFVFLGKFVDALLDLPPGTCTPMHAVLIQEGLKIAREMNAGFNPDYRDNVDDMAGYANVLAMVKERHYDSR